MHTKEIMPSKLLKLAKELKQVGFVVTFEPANEGFVINVKKAKPREKKAFLLLLSRTQWTVLS